MSLCAFWRSLLGKVGLYDVLVPLGAVVAAPGFLIRSLRHPEYRTHFRERLGLLPADLVSRLGALRHRPLWIQAVSVGEVILARTLIEAIAAHPPDAPTGRRRQIVLSSTTPAGRDSAASTTSALLAGVFHFPIDWSPFVRRLLDAVDPAVFISIETEIWPGLLRECAQRGIPALIVNGRISERSHGRYLRFRALLREPLEAVRLACMQSEKDAERARAIGLPPERVVVTGNMKFDAAAADDGPPSALRERLGLTSIGPPSMLVAGSTSAGEEEIALEAFELLRQSGQREVVLIIAPRHRERFEEVARLLERRGVRHARRSVPPARGTFDVLLLDTIGELAQLYSIATAAFVGGSLVPRGGQNPIEPAVRGVPVAFGPHTENFDAIARALVNAGAGFRVTTAGELADVWRVMLTDAGTRQRAGQAARVLTEAHRGATLRTIHHILPFIG